MNQSPSEAAKEPGEFGAHAREYATTMTNPVDRRYLIAIADALDKATVNSHDALVKALEEIAAANIERETVTPVNSFRAFGQANSELIRLRDIARAALSRAKECEEDQN